MKPETERHYTQGVSTEEGEEIRRLRAENEELGLRIIELSGALGRITEARDNLNDSCQSLLAELEAARLKLAGAEARLARITEFVATEGIY